MIPAEELWRQMLAGVTAQAIVVAAELSVPDHIGEGEVDVDQIATTSGAVPGRLYRILRLLASQGIFRETLPRRFANTPMSDVLRQGHPASQRDFAVWVGRLLHPGMSELFRAVQTNQPSFDLEFGAPLFEYLSQHPDQSEVFTRAMANAANLRGDLATSYSWPDEGTVVDVGGADGAILTHVLRDHPSLRGVVFDLPHIAPAAERAFDVAGVSDRSSFVGGSFFEEVWAGGDIYMLSAVIHDWDDESASAILANCRRAMGMDGRLLILDYVLPSTGEWHPGKVLDVVMLALTTGRERTEVEWKELLGQAGFSIEAITPSPRVSLIEAIPIAETA